MNKAIVRWNEDRGMWELLIKAAGEKDWTWSRGWIIRDVLPQSGKGFIYEDILDKISELQRAGWLVTVIA